MLFDMHRIAIHLRSDQYEWLTKQKCPGKSISHHIRELIDSGINAAKMEETAITACGTKTL